VKDENAKVMVKINGRDTSIGVYSSAYLPVTLVLCWCYV